MSTYYDEEFDDLKGKKISSVEWNEETLRFNLPGEAIAFKAEGMCCSSSYIESLDNPEIFKDATFLSVESVEGETKEVKSEDEDNWGQDVHKWTFYKFKTDKGMCTLSFRNESNGYYDGYLKRIK